MDDSDIRSMIREVPDWPRPGVSFKDITALLRSPEAFRYVVGSMAKRFSGRKIDAVASAEARGFIFGSAVAYELGVPFIPMRKKGKLPMETISATFSKEYGEDSLHMHKDAVLDGENVLLVDDVLATGGTMRAAAELVGRLGGRVQGMCFLLEMLNLKGREALSGFDVYSVLSYDR